MDDRSRCFVRDAVLVTVIVAGWYALAESAHSSLRVPGFGLAVGFDLLAAGLAPDGATRAVLFTAYLLGLGLGGAVIGRAIRRRAGGPTGSSWRIGIAGALAILGGGSLLLAASAFLEPVRREPVLVTATTGLFALALAGWLTGALELDLAPSSR